ncbi:MAG: ogr/Delta-like zinc finger family protein [Pseudohongiellaceae bacterium]
MRIQCPFCQHRAIIRSSRRPSPLFYEIYAQCQSAECGWSGKIHVEFVMTLSPSRSPRPDITLPIDSQSRRALLDQLQQTQSA